MNPRYTANLQKGQKTQFSGETAGKNALKAQESRKRKKNIRELATIMLQAPIEVDEKAKENVKKMGFDFPDNPELQMMILARLGAMAIGKDAGVAMAAQEKLMEYTGNDVRSHIEAERRQLERERLAFEREQLEFERTRQIVSKESNNGKIDELIAGLNELRDTGKPDGSTE